MFLISRHEIGGLNIHIIMASVSALWKADINLQSLFFLFL